MYLAAYKAMDQLVVEYGETIPFLVIEKISTTWRWEKHGRFLAALTVYLNIRLDGSAYVIELGKKGTFWYDQNGKEVRRRPWASA